MTAVWYSGQENIHGRYFYLIDSFWSSLLPVENEYVLHWNVYSMWLMRHVVDNLLNWRIYIRGVLQICTFAKDLLSRMLSPVRTLGRSYQALHQVTLSRECPERRAYLLRAYGRRVAGVQLKCSLQADKEFFEIEFSSRRICLEPFPHWSLKLSWGGGRLVIHKGATKDEVYEDFDRMKLLERALSTVIPVNRISWTCTRVSATR